MDEIAGWPLEAGFESLAVVGSSLGGFYATAVAERTGCKAVLLNPAVEPARDLARYIGEQTAWHDPDEHFSSSRVLSTNSRPSTPGRSRHPKTTWPSSPRATRCWTGAKWRAAMRARTCASSKAATMR